MDRLVVVVVVVSRTRRGIFPAERGAGRCFFPRAGEDTEHREGWLGDGAFARRVSVGDIDWRATGAGSVGRTIGRFSSLCSDVFRTVDRSSHAYSTALSTPPSQEGKNHPRAPGAPLRHPLSVAPREREDEAGDVLVCWWMDGWGWGG